MKKENHFYKENRKPGSFFFLSQMDYRILFTKGMLQLKRAIQNWKLHERVQNYKLEVEGPCHLVPLVYLIMERLLIQDGKSKGGDYASARTIARSSTLFPPAALPHRQQWETESVHPSSHGAGGAHPGILSAPRQPVPSHHRVQYVSPCTLSWLKLAGYTGPPTAPAQTLKSQLCWELWSSSGLLSPFVIMFNPADTCLGFETLLIKRDEKTFLSICIQILQINTMSPG